MNTSGILALVHGMRVYLASYSPATVVTACGWRQRPQQINQAAAGANRIILYPGLEPGATSGPAGTLTRSHRPSTSNPRALLTWEKLITMSVWAVDTTDTYDEEKQIAAVENLLELAVQAVHYSLDPATNTPVGLANIEWGSLRYTNPPEMRFGQEILAEFMQKCPLFDQTVEIAHPQPGIRRDPSTFASPVPRS